MNSLTLAKGYLWVLTLLHSILLALELSPPFLGFDSIWVSTLLHPPHPTLHSPLLADAQKRLRHGLLVVAGWFGNSHLKSHLLATSQMVIGGIPHVNMYI